MVKDGLSEQVLLKCVMAFDDEKEVKEEGNWEKKEDDTQIWTPMQTSIKLEEHRNNLP